MYVNTLLQNKYFNPRSPHGERLATPEGIQRYLLDFNPRSPHGERPKLDWVVTEFNQFQSTLSSRRASNWTPC